MKYLVFLPMRKTTSYLLILGFILGGSILSCDSDGNCPPLQKYFEIKGLQGFLSIEEPYSYPEIFQVSKDQYAWDSIIFAFRFEARYYSQSRNVGGSQLFALSCLGEDGYLGEKIGVKAASFHVAEFYNEDFPAGAILNPIINAGNGYYTDHLGYFVPLDYHILSNKESIKSTRLDLSLRQAPKESGTFNFYLLYELNDGQKFRVDLPSVFLR